MKKNLYLVSLLAIIFFSCKKENNDPEPECYDVIFKMGSVCGWCARADSLTREALSLDISPSRDSGK
jgi:hypothetical protein